MLKNVYDLNETRKRLQYAMARKNKMQTFTAKKVTTTRVLFFFFFFLSALVLYVAVSHNDLNWKKKNNKKNFKDGFT